MPSFDFPVAEIQHCQLNSCRVSWTQLLHLPTGPFWLHASSCCVMMSVSITVSLISLLGTRVSHHDCRGLIGVLKFDLQKFCCQTTRTVVWQSPHEEFIRMCHHLHPEAVIDESLMGKIRRLSELSPVTFSTDGSCHFPHHKTSRFAALMSLLPMTNVEIWPNSSNLLDAFPIPYTSHCSGTHHRCTHRSELFALENLGMV